MQLTSFVMYYRFFVMLILPFMMVFVMLHFSFILISRSIFLGVECVVKGGGRTIEKNSLIKRTGRFRCPSVLDIFDYPQRGNSPDPLPSKRLAIVNNSWAAATQKSRKVKSE